ncbi:MAG: hypothetical protein U0793_33360 [Gemmataceae bacterium]
MRSLALEKVVVYLKAPAWRQHAFGHALDWAERLHVPLRGLIDNRVAGDAQAQPAQQGFVTGDATFESSSWRTEPRLPCVAGALYVVADANPELLLESARAGAPLLLCPDRPAPLRRLLVVVQDLAPDNPFLVSVARLCQALDTRPVVLLVCRTERQTARLGYVEGLLDALGVSADLDALVTSNATTALGQVASWRNCSHIVIERDRPTSWWLRLRGDPLDRAREAAAGRPILTLPRHAALELPKRTCLPADSAWVPQARMRNSTP